MPAVHLLKSKGGLWLAHAGETARETGDFHCQSCNPVVHVTKGKKIPECPNDFGAGVTLVIFPSSAFEFNCP